MERNTVQYQAVTKEEAQGQYEADSAQAIAAGWVVETVAWEQASPPMLTVTYTRTPRPPGWQAPAAPKPGPSAGRALSVILLAALAVVAAIIAIAWLVTNS
jgi:hypothetical protein